MGDIPPPLPPRPTNLLPATRLTHPEKAPPIPHRPTNQSIQDIMSLPIYQTTSEPLQYSVYPTTYQSSTIPVYPVAQPAILPEPMAFIQWPNPTPEASNEVLEDVLQTNVIPTNGGEPSTSTMRVPTVKPRTKPVPAVRMSLLPPKQEEETIYADIPARPEEKIQQLRDLTPTHDLLTLGGMLIDEWGSDTESTSSEPCSWLAEEPLYQFTSCYESVPVKLSYTNIEVEDDTYSDELLDAQATSPRRTAHKTPWCGVTRVIDTNITGRMSKQSIAVQEAKFEILTTETSFLKTLTTMKKHFITSRELTNESILLREDHNQLFSLIKPIQKCSKAFLRDLDKCWKRSIFLPGIFEVISHHAKENFNCYVKYCAQLEDIRDKLKALLSVNKKLKLALTQLESSECCSKLPLYSFLSIPMKRIVNLNLLLKTARSALLRNYECDKTLEFEIELGNCLTALDLMQQVCKRSDNESQTTTRIKKLFDFHSKLKFPVNILQVSIISPNRWLVMHGDVKVHGMSEMENGRSSFVLKKTKSLIKMTNKSLRLFLLNDLLILTKPINDGFKVRDYCTLGNIQICTPNTFMSLNPDLVLDTKREFKILLILQANHENKRVEMVLSCAVQKERDVWVKTLKQHKLHDTGDKMPSRRMVCVYPFHTFEDGQIALMRGDEVIVNRTLDNGWLAGVRKRGNESGTFPPSRVEDASSVFPLVEIFN